jgi:hypothetical protein
MLNGFGIQPNTYADYAAFGTPAIPAIALGGVAFALPQNDATRKEKLESSQNRCIAACDSSNE